MTIVRCPRCRDEVTVPTKASGQALVRCPLCLEEYLLAEATAQLPPPLIVISDEMHTGPAFGVEEKAAPTTGDEYVLAGDRFSPGPVESSAPVTTRFASAAPTVKSVPRQKRKEKSALAELVKIVLGGVAGLALGVVVLWWFFRIDVADLGPSVSKYVPWMVPAQFHGRTNVTANKSSAASPKLSGLNDRSKSDQGVQAARDSESKSRQAATRQAEQLPNHNNEAIDSSLDVRRSAAAKKKRLVDSARASSQESNEPDRKTEPSANSPPMPDLRDLLPDGAPASPPPKREA
jgi:hypothetical protein